MQHRTMSSASILCQFNSSFPSGCSHVLAGIALDPSAAHGGIDDLMMTAAPFSPTAMVAGLQLLALRSDGVVEITLLWF